MVYGRARSPRQIWIPGMGVGIWDGKYGAMIKLQHLREIKRGLIVTDGTPPNMTLILKCPTPVVHTGTMAITKMMDSPKTLSEGYANCWQGRISYSFFHQPNLRVMPRPSPGRGSGLGWIY